MVSYGRCHRVRSWAFERLEPCEGKLSCTVLRGGNGRKVIPLPDLSVWSGFSRGSGEVQLKPRVSEISRLSLEIGAGERVLA